MGNSAMGWHFWVAIGVGLVLASLTDWLFAGVLFHDRYGRYPEVWRTPGNNTRGIVIAQALTVPTVVGMVAMITAFGIIGIGAALLMATSIWAIAALPGQVVNGVFVKIDPAVVAAHTAGWWVKLASVAVAAVVIARW